MRTVVIRVLVAITVIATSVGVTAISQAEPPAPEPDFAYCPLPPVPGGLAGGIGYNSPLQATPANNGFHVDLTCTTLGGQLGDEAGPYTLALDGTTFASCGGETGSGVISGTTPEGAISDGTFTFFRGGIHFYFHATYKADGEDHVAGMWIDFATGGLPTIHCPTQIEYLIGHGAFSDIIPPPWPTITEPPTLPPVTLPPVTSPPPPATANVPMATCIVTGTIQLSDGGAVTGEGNLLGSEDGSESFTFTSALFVCAGAVSGACSVTASGGTEQGSPTSGFSGAFTSNGPCSGTGQTCSGSMGGPGLISWAGNPPVPTFHVPPFGDEGSPADGPWSFIAGNQMLGSIEELNCTGAIDSALDIHDGDGLLALTATPVPVPISGGCEDVDQFPTGAPYCSLVVSGTAIFMNEVPPDGA
jgi:hypothetical protein